MLKKILILTIILLGLNLPSLAFDFTDPQTGLLELPDTSPEAQKYNLEVAKKIISNFELPQTDAPLSTVILFRINLQGKIIDYQITQSSGDTDYDNRVISAIKKSEPYPIPTYENLEEFKILLNMDLSIIKLIKMLSDYFDTPITLPTTPKMEQVEQPKQEPTSQNPIGKRFINLDELENIELE